MTLKPLTTPTPNFIFAKDSVNFYINNFALTHDQLRLFIEMHGYEITPTDEWDHYHQCLSSLLELERELPEKHGETLFDCLIWFITSDMEDVENATREAVTKIKLRSYSSTYEN